MKASFRTTTRFLCCVAGTVAASTAFAQSFSLDDNPSMPLVSAPVPPFLGAEDPYGLGLPASLAGLMAPSPSLLVGPYLDAAILRPGQGVPARDIWPPVGDYLDALSGNHFNPDEPWLDGEIVLRFSVDRATSGLPGSASFAEAMLNQQPGDIYESDHPWPHPFQFVGQLGPGPFAGILPTAGMGGNNLLYLDESQLMLTAMGGPGALIGPGVPCPPIVPGSHDNVDAFNETPAGVLDVDGDNVTDFGIYFSVPPAEFWTGLLPAGIWDLPPGVIQLPFGAPAYAWPNQMGLDMLVPQEGSDNIDSLVVWDIGALHSPTWGGPGAEPALDFALFTLSPGSATLMALGLPASTVFFTDFTGAFAVYCLDIDLALDSPLGWQWSNIDALEVKQIPKQPCVGDLDGDGDTDQADLGILLAAYNVNGGGDLDADGDTDQGDLGILLADYGCTP